MKVLLVHDSATGGGGGPIAMYRLHLGLRKSGIDSKILCKFKGVGDSDAITIPEGRLVVGVQSRLRKVTSRLGLNDIHCLSTFSIRQLQAYIEADVLDFHCIHEGWFNYLALPCLTEPKPAVFSLHDMWPFTGHCAQSYGCDRWKIGCGKCPHLSAPPSVRRDATRLEWKLKAWVYGRSNLTVVAQSKWLTEQAKHSMLNRFPIYHIPNGVDTDVYQPRAPEQCRSLLGIPPGKKVLLFVAPNLTDFGKGGDLLVKALHTLPTSLKAETVLLLLGHGGNVLADAVGIQTLDLGYVHNDRLKALAYSAADLYVLPSRAENHPLTLLESMACGTPMISFNIGGVPDTVQPGITGYLAEPENARDLCDGIIQLLEDVPLRARMSQQCREIAEKEYSLGLQVQRYIALYHHILQSDIGSGSG